MGITRLLVLVIPAVILMTLGLNYALEWAVHLAAWLVKRVRKGRPPHEKSLTRTHAVLALVLALVLVLDQPCHAARCPGEWPTVVPGLHPGRHAVRRPPVVHCGDLIITRTIPALNLMVSPSWTNGADAVADFFLPEGAPVALGSVEGHIFQRLPLDENMVFVVIPNELDKLLTSGKFEDVRIEQTIEYPNGEPGFYFIRMRYVA